MKDAILQARDCALDSEWLNTQYAMHVLGWAQERKDIVAGDEYWDIIDPQGNTVEQSRYGIHPVLIRHNVQPCDTEERRTELINRLTATN